MADRGELEPTPGQQKGAKPLGAALVAVVGAVAALGLFQAVPREESGRTVQATVQADGGIAVKNVAGRQYLSTYLDIVGVRTACDGLTRDEHGRPLKAGQHFTEDQCMAMLEAELVDEATHVMDCTPGLQPAGHDHQRIAAVMLAHNIGWPRFCKSSARARFNTHDYAAACDRFLPWDKAGGRPVKGLHDRRVRERALCLADVQRPLKRPAAASDGPLCIAPPGTRIIVAPAPESDDGEAQMTDAPDPADIA
jgi:lysozyme